MKKGWKKYNVIYKNGKVVETKEVVDTPPTAKPPGPDRAGQVLEECKKLGIKDPAVIQTMLAQKYAGTKSDNYLASRLKHILKLL